MTFQRQNKAAEPPHTIPAGLRLFLSTLTALTLFAGCEKTDLGTVDDTGLPPRVLDAALSPAIVNIDSLPSSGGSATITILAVATVSDQAGNPAVSAELFRPLASSPFLGASLRDDGINPDNIAGDGVFAASLEFQATRAQAGEYRLGIDATNEHGQRSGVFTTSMALTRNNSAPRLDSLSLQAPDTLTRPTATFSLMTAVQSVETRSQEMACFPSCFH